MHDKDGKAALERIKNKLKNSEDMNRKDLLELDRIQEVVLMTRLGQMILEKGEEKGIEKGIEALIETCREFGLSREVTAERVGEKFSLPCETSKGYVEKYWREENPD